MRSDVSLQSMILIEIQDTMAQPPSEEKSMKKATHTGIAITVSLLSIKSEMIDQRLCPALLEGVPVQLYEAHL